MQQRTAEIGETNLAVLVVTFETPERARRYAGDMQLSWPLLVDESRKLAHGYGMGHGRAWDLYGPAATWTYLKLLAQGRRLKKPTDDVTQLGGDVLIDGDGIVRLHYVGRGPSDRPAIETILRLARQVGR